jgi:hypothetical protein
MIHVIRHRASKQQMQEMLEGLGTYIKLAVVVRSRTLAGGGTLHADCESVLLKEGSQQEDIWGADWNPIGQEVTFESLINIRPRQSNRTLEIEDPVRREQVARIVTEFLGGVDYA